MHGLLLRCHFDSYVLGIYAFQGLSEFWGGMVPIVVISCFLVCSLYTVLACDWLHMSLLELQDQGVMSMTGSVVCIQCCVTMEVILPKLGGLFSKTIWNL